MLEFNLINDIASNIRAIYEKNNERARELEEEEVELKRQEVELTLEL